MYIGYLDFEGVLFADGEIAVLGYKFLENAERVVVVSLAIVFEFGQKCRELFGLGDVEVVRRLSQCLWWEGLAEELLGREMKYFEELLVGYILGNEMVSEFKE
jgi:hypothetical protein